MRQTTVLSAPRWSLGRGVCAGCRESLLDHGPSRHYLCHLCRGAWTYTPPCSSGALTHFFPNDSGLTSRETRSAHGEYPCTATSPGSVVSGLQSFAHVQAPPLARPPDRSHRSPQTGRPGRLHHASPKGLPTLGCGIATCLIWATDMAGLAPARWQPCRLLLPALRFPVHFVPRVMRPIMLGVLSPVAAGPGSD